MRFESVNELPQAVIAKACVKCNAYSVVTKIVLLEQTCKVKKKMLHVAAIWSTSTQCYKFLEYIIVSTTGTWLHFLLVPIQSLDNQFIFQKLNVKTI
jgi:hypothetical protein